MTVVGTQGKGNWGEMGGGRGVGGGGERWWRQLWNFS